MSQSSPIACMGEKWSTAHTISLQLMPILMILGAIMSLGANFFLPPLILIIFSLAVVIYWFSTLKNLDFRLEDLRFAIVPLAIIVTGYLTLHDNLPAFYDQAYHLQISNRILDRWAWEPTHQGMSYSFRPEIVSGIAAIEMWITGSVNSVFLTPTLFLLACAYSIQHLAEKYSSKQLGFLAAIIFCFFPVVVTYGRTMLLDVAVAGMIISVIHHLLIAIEDASEKSFLLLGLLSGIIGLTKYPYLYFGGMIWLVLLAKQMKIQAKFLAIGYGIVIGLFFIKNLIHTGSIIGPMQSQIFGTFASMEAISSDSVTYTPNNFLFELYQEWTFVTLCLSIYGTALIIKNNREFLLYSWLCISPAILLHGFILDFGWVRYSTPWIALICIGIPASIHYSNFEFGNKTADSKVPSMIILVLLLLSSASVTLNAEGTFDSSEKLYKIRTDWMKIYEQTGELLEDDSVIITGSDITMGLHSQTETYRPENQYYPYLQAIEKFDATHIFTQDQRYRFDIDVNASFLFGSPIEPLSSISVNGETGRIWEVNHSRLEQADYWQNNSLDIDSSIQSGDFVWVPSNTNFELPDNVSIFRILATGDSLNLDDLFNAHINPSLLKCDSKESCSSIGRSTHLEENWAFWVSLQE
jgi:hypothetical protein